MSFSKLNRFLTYSSTIEKESRLESKKIKFLREVRISLITNLASKSVDTILISNVEAIILRRSSRRITSL